MKTTLDLPADLIRDVERRAARDGRQIEEAMAELLRNGLDALPTVKTVVVSTDASTLERRARLTEKFISGEWGVELAGFEAARAADRASASTRAQAWRN